MMGGPRYHGQYRAMRRVVRRLFGTPKQHGFTVIEVMIVLAVSALIFVVAAAQISGRQNRTAFEVAIREIQSQIQKVINEVSVGSYPDFSNVTCLGSPTGPIITAAASAGQGVNQDCIFMGKVLQFKVAGTNPEQFKTYTIAGLRLDPSTSTDVDVRASAWPKVIAPSSSSPGIPNNAITETLQSSLTTHSMVWGASNTPVGAVAFSQSLAQYSGGNLVSGSQRVEVAPVNGTTLSMSAQAAAEAINTNWATSTLNPANGVRICFASGTTNQSGLITIGSNNRELSVTLDIRGNSTCA